METRNTEEETYRNRSLNFKTVKQKDPLVAPKASSILLLLGSDVHLVPITVSLLVSKTICRLIDSTSLSTAGKSEQHSFAPALGSLLDALIRAGYP